MMYGTVDEIVELLRQDFDRDAIVTLSIWTKQDVEYCVEERGPDVEVTDDFAMEVLRVFHTNEDAESGLNWDTLEDAIHTVAEREELTQVDLEQLAEEEEISGDPDDFIFMQEDCPVTPICRENEQEEDIT